MARFSSRHHADAGSWWARLDACWTTHDRLKAELGLWPGARHAPYLQADPAAEPTTPAQQAAAAVRGTLYVLTQCEAWWTGLLPLTGGPWTDTFQPVSAFVYRLAQSPQTGEERPQDTRAALVGFRQLTADAAYTCGQVAEAVADLGRACAELPLDATDCDVYSAFPWAALSAYFAEVHATVRGLHDWLEDMVDSWQASPTESYLLDHCGPVGDPRPEEWGSPELIAATIRKKALQLDLQGSGCALLNHAVVMSLKGTATLPTRVPGTAYRYTESGTAETYGRGVALSGRDALHAYFEKHGRDGGIWIVEMTGSRLRVGHGVTVLCRGGEFSYVDAGLGGGRRAVLGPLERADWHTNWGFDTFRVYDAGDLHPVGDPAAEWDGGAPRSNWHGSCSIQ